MKNYSMIWAYTYLNDEARLKRCGVAISERRRRRGELQFKPTTLVIERRQRGEEEFFESAPKGEDSWM